MEDLFGLGKGSEKLIEVIANAVGAVYRPFGIRREADAEAYKLRVIEKARIEQKAEEVRALASAKRDEVLILDTATSALEERAAARKRFDELRRQSNLENVLRGAFDHIKDEVSQEPVDPDWLQALLRNAEEANSAHLQDLWSRVLAGETEVPGSFSLRALETLKKMSRRDAEAFQDICRIASFFKDSCQLRVISSFYNSSVGNTLKEAIKSIAEAPSVPKEIDLRNYNCGLHNRKALDDLGLLYEEEITSSKFRTDGVEMFVAGYRIKLTPKSESSKLYSYEFTQVGNELSSLIDPMPQSNYFAEFIKSGEDAFTITQLDDSDT